MSYTVKIIDNDNGMVVADRADVRGIIGALMIPEGCQGLFSTSCNAQEIAQGVFTVQRVCDIAKKTNPRVGLLAALAENHKDEIPSTVIDLSPLKERKDGD